MECFAYWNAAAQHDQTIDLMEIFGLNWSELTKPFSRAGARAPPFFKVGGPAAKTLKDKQNAALLKKEELEMWEEKELLAKFQKNTTG